jgi:hypothetical protein
MPASVIDRFGTASTFGGPVVTATLPVKRNELMERISRQARRLRGAMNPTPTLAHVGRNDSLEALVTRLGIVPVVVIPNSTSLTGTLQAPSGRRPSPTEITTVTGPTAAATFAAGGPAQSVAFAAGGTGQVLAATDSVDAAAKGRALIDVAP